MIHGTRMILVPQELARALNGDLPKAPAPVGSYSAMDEEMSNILKSKNIDDFTKWKRYNNVLQRYMAKVERTKHSLTVNIDDDDDVGDPDGGVQQQQQQQPPTPQAPKKGKNVIKPPPDKADGDGGALSPPKKRTRRVLKPPVIPKSKSNHVGLKDILNSLATAKEKKEARELFNALEESKQTVVTKTGILKIKRKNVGLLEPLIRYKIKGTSGEEPVGWSEFSGFITGLKGLPKNKATSVVTRQGSVKLVGNGRTWLTY
jgi:hypothetical protein